MKKAYKLPVTCARSFTLQGDYNNYYINMISYYVKKMICSLKIFHILYYFKREGERRFGWWIVASMQVCHIEKIKPISIKAKCKSITTKKNHVSYEPLEALYDVYHILYIIKKINKNY